MAQQTMTERVAKYQQMTRSEQAEVAREAFRGLDVADERGLPETYRELQMDKLRALDEVLPEGENAGDLA